jgi:putative glycosyltransferase
MFAGCVGLRLMKLSVVTSLYKSAAFLPEFYERITNAARRCTDDYELVFVDDGSPDDSGAQVRALMERDPRVVLVELSRNFGHHNAALAGVMSSRGDIVFYLDVDLEDQPEWLDLLYRELEQSQCDIVYVAREQRAGNWFRRWSGSVFYHLFNTFSDVKIVPNICSACLMRRSFVEAMRNMQEKNLFLAAAMAWMGFRTRVVTVQRSVRATPSNYTFWRSLRLAANAVTSFSAYPLHLIFTLGLLISLGFGGMGAYMLIKKLLFPHRVFYGYASIMVSIWFLGGVLILFIGIIGIYLAKIFTEVKSRPQYVIRQIQRAQTPQAGMIEGGTETATAGQNVNM